MNFHGPFQLAVALFATALISACSSTSNTQIGEYGTAVEKLTNQIDEAINTANASSIDFQLASLVERSQYSSSQGKYNGRCFIQLSKIENNVDNNQNICTTIGSPTLEDITPLIPENKKKMLFVYRANRALRAYGQSLQKLNDAVSTEQITAASIKLNNSLHGINEQYEALTGDTKKLDDFDNGIDIISTSMTAIGRTIAESKRQDAMKTVISKADPWIQELTKELEKSLEDGLFTSLTDVNASTTLRRQYTMYNDLVRDSKLSPEQRRTEVNKLYTAWQEYSTRDMKGKALLKAVKAIGLSHTKLQKEVDKDIFASSEISDTVSELTDYYKQLSSFHELLDSCAGKLELEKKDNASNKNNAEPIYVCKESS
mgnify:CR=1 FL=1